MSSSDRVSLIAPDWADTGRVHAFTTTREGGVSEGPWGLAGGAPGGWNLGAHCGDSVQAVRANRARLRRRLPAEPIWLEQVHGTDVFDADAKPLVATTGATVDSPHAANRPRADAAITTRPGVVLAVLTADCVPVLFSDRAGTGVGVAHAGWRGLAAGVLEATAAALGERVGGGALRAWLGPAIGPGRFEVGADVLDAFVAVDPAARAAFAPTGRAGKWLADLYLLARQRLVRCGVSEVSGGEWCTASSSDRFYSFRRDRVTGRMASLIWID